MLSHRQTKRLKTLRPPKQIITPLPRQEPRKQGMVRLPYHPQLLATLLNDHPATTPHPIKPSLHLVQTLNAMQTFAQSLCDL
jgi:hypothetical protein